MKRLPSQWHTFQSVLNLERLEERNAASDTWQALWAGFNDPPNTRIVPFPSERLNIAMNPSLAPKTSPDSTTAAERADNPQTRETDGDTADSHQIREPEGNSDENSPIDLQTCFRFPDRFADSLSIELNKRLAVPRDATASNVPSASSAGMSENTHAVNAKGTTAPTPTDTNPLHGPENQTATSVSQPTSLNNPPVFESDHDGVSDQIESLAPNHGDGNRDGIPDAMQDEVASLQASNGQFVTVDGEGHTLTNVQMITAAQAGVSSSIMPLGLYKFNIHNVVQGGAATIKMILPNDLISNHYFKQDAHGKLQNFDFNGTTGAEFNGNVVKLHFIDGGRGDADGVANGVIVDPGGPGGYGSYPVVMEARVCEVTFSGSEKINIVADPGTPQYAGSDWIDLNGNGVIDAEGEQALPVGYPRNSDVIVSAHFNAAIQNWPYPPSNYQLMVRGSPSLSAYNPYNFTVPPTYVTLSGTDLYLPPTPISNPFPSYANYGSLKINWEFSKDGGNLWSPAGVSENELYVPLRKPDDDVVYHTVIHFSVPWVAQLPNSSTNADYIASIWNMSFVPLNLGTRHSTSPIDNGVAITYYKEWTATAGTAAGILDKVNNPTRDGKCTAFAELFAKSIRDAGIDKTAVPILGKWVVSKINVNINLGILESFLVKNWRFQDPGQINILKDGATYTHVNTLDDPTKIPGNAGFPGGFNSFMRKNNAGVWEYYWGNPAQVTHSITDGIKGQNNPNPKSTFDSHALIEIAGKIYDPSYGAGPFNNLREWEDAAIDGFINMEQLPDNTARMILRKNQAAVVDMEFRRDTYIL